MEMLLNIDVPNLKQAEEFYCAAFDLHVGRRLGSKALELIGGPLPIYLLLKAEGSAPTSNAANLRTYKRHWSPIHLDIVVPDINTSTSKVLAAGAIQEGPITVFDWGKLGPFADPFGHGFCLIEFVGSGYDEIAVE